ncbi:MAG: aldo/keto reductase family protein [Granulosicoccus sp.]
MKTILGTMTFSSQVDKQTATKMVNKFVEAGHTELDTAYVYNKGQTETLLGELNAESALQGTKIAGKANPAVAGGLSPASIEQQLTTSLKRLNQSSLDLFYLHSPDPDVPIRDSLRTMSTLHQQGLFDRFGLSNYAAWQVAEAIEICQQEGWVAPSVYQGMYNALTRDVERELLPCLANYEIAFYVYNPLAGGMLSGKHQSIDALPASGRFASFDGYQARYWKPAYVDEINYLSALCRENEIEPATAALRWLVHHSALAGLNIHVKNESYEHGVIIGASSLAHFNQNLQAITEPPLPSLLVDAFDNSWEQVRPACIKYFRP